MNQSNQCAQCGCAAPKNGHLLSQLTSSKAPICAAKKQYAILKKQEERRAEIRQHNIEALKEYIRNAKFMTTFGVFMMLIPVALSVALRCDFSAFAVATAACIFAMIFAILVSRISSNRASDLQMFSDILERMDSTVNEDLHL
jgi:hypothetical protein